MSVLCSPLLHSTHLLQLPLSLKEVYICPKWRSRLLKSIGKVVMDSNALFYRYLDSQSLAMFSSHISGCKNWRETGKAINTKDKIVVPHIRSLIVLSNAATPTLLSKLLTQMRLKKFFFRTQQVHWHHLRIWLKK